MARVQCTRCFMDNTKEGFEGESWMFEFRPGNGFLRKKPSFVVWKETSSSLVLNVFECYSSWTGLSVLFLTTKFRDKGDESWVSLVGTDLRNGVCSYFFVLDTFVNVILKVDEVLLLGSRFMNIYWHVVLDSCRFRSESFHESRFLFNIQICVTFIL